MRGSTVPNTLTRGAMQRRPCARRPALGVNIATCLQRHCCPECPQHFPRALTSLKKVHSLGENSERGLGAGVRGLFVTCKDVSAESRVHKSARTQPAVGLSLVQKSLPLRLGDHRGDHVLVVERMHDEEVE